MVREEIHRYVVRVDPAEPVAAQWEDELAGPLVNGVMDLTATGYRTLTDRLNALEGDDLIGFWTVERFEPQTYSIQSEILLAIVADLEDEDAQEVSQVWHNTAAGVS